MGRKPANEKAMRIFLKITAVFLMITITSLVTAETYRSPDEQRVIEIYKKASKAVVFISTISIAVDPFDIFFDIKPKEGTGSGIIVDQEKGIIITNLHVIKDAQKIQILLDDGKGYKANLLGFDEDMDLAVLQIQQPHSESLTALPFGDSSALEVGQRILAIGNPFGFNRSLTTGIISSLDRMIRPPKGRALRGLIQIDAAINPGNSGGPLIDMDGKLIGVTTAIISQSGDSSGVSFAVPINQIKRTLPELIATGKVLKPWIGWALIDTNYGVMVRRVTPNSPAERAGVEPLEKVEEAFGGLGYTMIRDFSRADIIIAVNNEPVKNLDDLENKIAKSANKPIRLSLRKAAKISDTREITLKAELK
ncbi:MAG TPA: trypsin-like peptidase domain-containing protein [Oligoflexia bacterium]|mgnify:CR=1 FL=1|nr:trypsin-like peptidase domain-containing protein [Oligoflexia bacterium]HMP27562.1 trypsin-like peptidase domain-containing protein [Oligoflexia bacterium]